MSGYTPPSPFDELLGWFAPLAEDTEPARQIRGTALAVAQHWLVYLPDGKARAAALYRLREAADLACEALTG